MATTTLTLSQSNNPTRLSLFGVDYVLIETNAPRVYDYDVLPFGPDVGPCYETRFGLVRADQVSTQFMRYASGLYTGVVSNLYDADTLVCTLYARMMKGDA